MAKYCTMCGSPMADSASARCDSCLAEQEQAASTASSAYRTDTTESSALSGYIELILAAFVRPEPVLTRIVGFKNAWTGLALAIAHSLVVSLVALAFLHRLVGGIGSFLNGFSGMMAGEMLGNSSISVHYGSFFFRLFLMLLLQWLLLSCALMLTTRWFKQPLAIVPCLNLVGLSKIYFGAGCLIALIFSYLFPALGLAALGVSTLLGYLAIERGVRAQSGSVPFYLMPATLLLYAAASIVVWKVLF